MNNNSFFILKIILLLFFCKCKPSNDCSDRQLVKSLLSQVTVVPAVPADDGMVTESEYLYDAVKVLEKLSNHKRQTEFGYWGEHYNNIAMIKVDSILYDSILTSLSLEELQQRVKDNCTDVVDILRFGSLDNLRIICPDYLGDLKKKCDNQNNRK